MIRKWDNQKEIPTRGPKEVDGLHLPPGKDSTLLADHLI